MTNQQTEDLYITQSSSPLDDISTGQPSEYPSLSNPADGNRSPLEENTGLLLVPLSFMIMAGVVLILLRSNLLKSFQNRLTPIKRLNQVPCLNCKYFKNDPYLKCAVNPCVVLTEEAANCTEYCSKNSQ